LTSARSISKNSNEEFGTRARRPNTALKDIREIVEQKLAAMLAVNPDRMDYYLKYQTIISEYNNEKDRATVEETFARLMALAASLDEEQQRAAREGLSSESASHLETQLGYSREEPLGVPAVNNWGTRGK
jgi:type I restriction enzyme R subunit